MYDYLVVGSGLYGAISAHEAKAHGKSNLFWYRANGQRVLYSKHHDKEYTTSLAFRLQRSDGSEVEKLHTAWTQKGRKFLYHTLKRRGVLPFAEQEGQAGEIQCFFQKPKSGTYLILDEGGYQVAGQKGIWLVSDEAEVEDQRFVQMRSEQTKNPPPSIIFHENGTFVMQTTFGFDGEASRKMRAFLQGQKPELLHYQKFFEIGTAERAKESGTEKNYNMINGCVNNVPRKPRRIGGRWSVLDRLHIKWPSGGEKTIHRSRSKKETAKFKMM